MVALDPAVAGRAQVDAGGGGGGAEVAHLEPAHAPVRGLEEDADVVAGDVHDVPRGGRAVLELHVQPAVLDGPALRDAVRVRLQVGEAGLAVEPLQAVGADQPRRAGVGDGVDAAAHAGPGARAQERRVRAVEHDARTVGDDADARLGGAGARAVQPLVIDAGAHADLVAGVGAVGRGLQRRQRRGRRAGVAVGAVGRDPAHRARCRRLRLAARARGANRDGAAVGVADDGHQLDQRVGREPQHAAGPAAPGDAGQVHAAPPAGLAAQAPLDVGDGVAVRVTGEREAHADGVDGRVGLQRPRDGRVLRGGGGGERGEAEPQCDTEDERAGRSGHGWVSPLLRVQRRSR